MQVKELSTFATSSNREIVCFFYSFWAQNVGSKNCLLKVEFFSTSPNVHLLYARMKTDEQRFGFVLTFLIQKMTGLGGRGCYLFHTIGKEHIGLNFPLRLSLDSLVLG